MNKKTLVVNVFGGPGCGKSTMMASIFAELKWRGIDCEMATEYAKDKVWEGSHAVLNDQFYVSGKQFHKLFRLQGNVDVVITDSPILLGLYYGKNEPPEFKDIIMSKHKSFTNFNVLLERKKEYNSNGRMQTEEQAKEIDLLVEGLLNSISENYIKIPGLRESVIPLVNLIEEKVNSLKLDEN